MEFSEKSKLDLATVPESSTFAMPLLDKIDPEKPFGTVAESSTFVLPE